LFFIFHLFQKKKKKKKDPVIRDLILAGHEQGLNPRDLAKQYEKPKDKVNNMLAAVSRKHGNGFDFDQISNLLSTYSSMVLYPKGQEMEHWKASNETLYVLSSTQLVENAKKNLSEVIGLDSFYKLCTDRWAVCVLVCRNNENGHFDPFGKKKKKKAKKKLVFQKIK
jgi:hypothetical protein